MEKKDRRPEARPIFRQGAGLVSVVCFLLVPVFCLVGEVKFALTLLPFLGSVMGAIYLTGKLPRK